MMPFRTYNFADSLLAVVCNRLGVTFLRTLVSSVQVQWCNIFLWCKFCRCSVDVTRKSAGCMLDVMCRM